jgi:hypothetical protein
MTTLKLDTPRATWREQTKIAIWLCDHMDPPLVGESIWLRRGSVEVHVDLPVREALVAVQDALRGCPVRVVESINEMPSLVAA